MATRQATSGEATSGRGRDPLSRDDPVTVAGLIFETAIGLRRAVGPPLERHHELPPQTLEVLVRLARSPGQRLRMADLASQTALTPSGLTRAVDRLAKAGLVRRDVCPSDRRGAFAALTESGHLKMAAALARHREQLEEILDGLFAEDERARLAELLERLRNRVNPGARQGSAPGTCEGAAGEP